jgi:hypothetical protein
MNDLGGLTPICHVRKVPKELLVLVGQNSRVPRRRQDGLLGRELFIEVRNVLQTFLEVKK